MFDFAILGYLGTLRLKIPWKKLKTEAIVIDIQDVFALAVPKTSIEVQSRSKKK